MPYINGMIVQSGGSKPHVVYIMEMLAKTFPNVIWKIGGKVNRTTWGGGFSAHSAGRACDIYLDANDPLDKKLGDLLFQMFCLQAAYLKVDHTIWNGRIWSTATTMPSAYTGSGGLHRDHVHVAFQNVNLNALPTGFDWMCKLAVAGYITGGGDGAADRQDGLYGQAFDPKNPNIRLSEKQRRKILLKNMGMEGADL
jgi:hypothetical protein